MGITQRQHGARESLRGRTFMHGICMQIYAYITQYCAYIFSIRLTVITDTVHVAGKVANRIGDMKRRRIAMDARASVSIWVGSGERRQHALWGGMHDVYIYTYICYAYASCLTDIRVNACS